MMNTLYVDSRVDDDTRRRGLYAGQLFVFSPRPSTIALRDHAREMIEEAFGGIDPLLAQYDVPRLRMVTSDGYLTSGVGYAHHPHRDTWYSAPMAQLNWWMPIFEFESSSAMAFHPRYFDEPVRNGSREFNYYEWNSVGRKDA